MRLVSLLVILVLLSGCSSDGGAEGKGETSSLSARALVDFDTYSFVAADTTTTNNLRDYIKEATPNGSKLVDVTVRSVEDDGEPVPAEIVAAAFDPSDLSSEELYFKVLKAVAPGKPHKILQGRGVLVTSEGTATVATFAPRDVLLYLIGPHAEDLEDIASGLLENE